MNEIQNFTKKDMSILKDPFKHSCVIGVRLVMSERLFDGGFDFDAYIEFKNGNTKGEQTIEGTSMDDIYNKTRDFIKTL